MVWIIVMIMFIIIVTLLEKNYEFCTFPGTITIMVWVMVNYNCNQSHNDNDKLDKIHSFR